MQKSEKFTQTHKIWEKIEGNLKKKNPTDFLEPYLGKE